MGVGVAGGLGAVTRAGLGEDTVDVGLDRRLREHERVGDLRVGEPARDGQQDLALAWRERGEAGVVIDGVGGGLG